MEEDRRREEYPEDETRRRFAIDLRAALNLPRKPHETVRGKDGEARPEAGKSAERRLQG